MSIQDSPNRVVRTIDSVIAFIGHGRATDGDILIECLVDMQSNQVKWRSSSKARYGKEFVEANEDLQVLIDYANLNPYPPPMDVVEEVVENPVESNVSETIPLWAKLGYPNKQAWVDAGRPGKN